MSSPTRKQNILLAFVFACFGITAEIIFTGVKYNLFLPIMNRGKIDLTLDGTSYIWMLFIYAAIPFIFPFTYIRIHKLNLVFRLFIYATICLCIEFISGALLDLITGDCPWRYTTGIHLMGYIRLDYFPIWMLFGFVVEKLYLKTLKLIN